MVRVSAATFENYCKAFARRLKKREVDLVIVVYMFLTGFNATTLNRLWVDKTLRRHGLIQGFSRTNRILNSVNPTKTLSASTTWSVDDELALFGNKDARDILLRNPTASTTRPTKVS